MTIHRFNRDHTLRDRDYGRSCGKAVFGGDRCCTCGVDDPVESIPAGAEERARIAASKFLKKAWLEERAAREEGLQERENTDLDFVENDQDLYPILLRAKDDELQLLATIISQKVSSSIDDGCRSPLAIASEIQLMGGNSVVNLFRGHGVGYKEIVLDVAEKMGVDKNILSRTGNSVASMEAEIIEKLFIKFAQEMNESDREHLSSKLERASTNTRYMLIARAILPHLLREFNLQGVVELALIIAASRAVVGWVPVVGWLSAGVGALLELSSTAYSVTIPCVVMIGLIRAKIHEEEYDLTD
jgi:uncharacterized protein YaaW (UPF0174 family)